jgi:ABC-type amino acid transport substrate-binding protein
MVLATVMASAAGLRILTLDSDGGTINRDSGDHPTGFTIEIARALCDEMQVSCIFLPTRLDRVVDQLVAGEADMAAVAMLETPERRGKILFTKPYLRSVSAWLAQPGQQPGKPDTRVAVVRASVQERYARIRGWETVPVSTSEELIVPLRSGEAQAALVPMLWGLALMKNSQFRQLKLESTVMDEPELSGGASFAISPRRSDLKPLLDDALDRIMRNGVYDRVNSRFLPLRVN